MISLILVLFFTFGCSTPGDFSLQVGGKEFTYEDTKSKEIRALKKEAEKKRKEAEKKRKEEEEAAKKKARDAYPDIPMARPNTGHHGECVTDFLGLGCP